MVLLLAVAVGAKAETATGPVDEVRVTGNKRVETEAIRSRLRSRAGTTVDPESVERDVRSIYAMGFFDDVQATIEDENGRRILVFRLVERPLIREVKLEGNDEISEEDLEGALKVRPYTILDLSKVQRGIEAAKKLYDQKGYPDATLTFTTGEPNEKGEIALTFKIDEGKIVRIDDIVFEGNEAFSGRKLRGLMQTKEEWFLSWATGAGNLDNEVLKTDVERLQAWYYDNGYVNVRIDEPQVERKEDGLVVTIKIDEGDQYGVGSVDVAGDVIGDKAEILPQLETKVDDVFHASTLRKDVLALTELYGDLGYAFANVEPLTTVDPEAKKVQVTFKVDKGPEVYFNRIEITGNTKTKDEVVRRELKVQEQQRFSSTRLRDSRARIQRLGFFQEVNLNTKRSDRPDQIDLLIDVKEAPTGAFTAGAGFSSADRFILNGRLQETNLFGTGDRVSLNIDFGSIRQDFTIDYIDPYFLDTFFTASFSAFRTRLEFDDFTREANGFSVQLLYPFTALGFERFLFFSLDEVRFGLEYQLDQSDIGDLDDFFRVPSIQAEEGRMLTSSVIPTLVRNTLNHPFDPTAGSVQDLSVEVAGLGGESDFLKVEGRSRWFYPFYKSQSLGTFVASAGGRFGWGYGDAGRSGNELPLFERFFPGGINSVRGFRARTLGPREPVFDPNNNVIDTTPVGGSSFVVFTGELIFPVIEALGLRGVIFIDAGNAYDEPTGLDLGDMRESVGWGIRWLSPIGPLRIEIGYPLDRRSGEKSSVFQFSFGAPL
jgi:outer membrane protein insertion porin family